MSPETRDVLTPIRNGIAKAARGVRRAPVRWTRAAGSVARRIWPW